MKLSFLPLSTPLLAGLCLATEAQNPAEPPHAPLRSEVLMGMKLESIVSDGAGTRVSTTGSEFQWDGQGAVRCFQRIPQRREVAQVTLPAGDLPLKLEQQNAFAGLFTAPGLCVTIQGDSLMIVRAERELNLNIEGMFQPVFQSEKGGNWMFADQTGGFGLYPSAPESPDTCGLVHRGVPDRRGASWFVNKGSPPGEGGKPWSLRYTLAAGEELWMSVFPPRSYNRKHADEILMAHEGSLEPYAHPATALIQSSAKHCKLMVVHSMLWPGGDRPPWRIPSFVPKDRREFDRVRDDLHRAGMKMVPYLSPYYYSGTEFFAELRRAVEDYRVDGAYFDGVSLDFRKSYEFVRRSRQILGDERILFTHCTSDPLKSTVVYCPFIDTYSDYIYRGEAGRAGMELDDFLRWTVSGYHISNAVGYWVYTGSTAKPAAPTKENPGGYVRQAPTREDIDAALRNEVRIPRTEIGYQPEILWEPNDGHLEFFDRYYYGELTRLGRKRESQDKK